jgi:tetratricopeptide (TPR) repeat protein
MEAEYTNIDTDGFLRKRILAYGPTAGGLCPITRNEVQIVYFGYDNSNGEILESHEDREEPFTYKLGDSGMVKGLNVGISTMTKGEKAEFIVAIDWAYGKDGFIEDPFIPPSTEMRYVVELLEFDTNTKFTKWDIPVDKRFETAVAYKAKGAEFFKAGQWEEALDKFEECIDFVEWEKSEEAIELKLACCLNSGLLLTKCRQFKSARARISWAINLRPDSAKGYFRRAQCYLEEQDFDMAIVDIKESLRLDSGNQDIRREYKKIVDAKNAYIRENQKMFSESLPKVADAIAMDDRKTTAYSDSVNPICRVELELRKDRFDQGSK